MKHVVDCGLSQGWTCLVEVRILFIYFYLEVLAVALSVKSPEAERLAREVANATGESITQAITTALQERLQRLQATQEFAEYARGVERVQRSIRERRVLDTRSADEIIGYGPDGAPR